MSAITIRQVHTALSGARGQEPSQVHRLLSQLRELLSAEAAAPYDGWLSHRGDGLRRERAALLDRLSRLRHHWQQEPDSCDLHAELRRLVVDVEHHLQRRRDLAWDEVQLELGGSE